MKPIIEPPDRRLQRKIGQSARAAISPADIKAAEAALHAVAAQIRPVVLADVEALEALSRQRPFNAPTQLYARAHSIRGLAGSCGLPKLGQAAGALCKLLDGVEDGAAIDANLVTSIAVTMIHAARDHDRDPELLDELIAACFEAVNHARPEAG